jgi:mycothiol synthase
MDAYPSLPPGYTMRPATQDDLDDVLELILASDVAEFGEPDFTREDLLEDWKDRDLPVDTWLAVAPDGQLAAYADIYHDDRHTEIAATVQVHPDHYGRGLGACLLGLTEARAREHIPQAPPGARVVVRNTVNSYNPRACSLLERHGYTQIRRFWRMQREFGGAPPPSPSWPEGIVLRSFVPGRDERGVFDTVEDAFRDHWGHSERDFEGWIRQTKRIDFDPGLWFLALEGEEVAGVALCWDWGEMGWVRTLGVRRPWRRRGLGLALLYHAFGEFFARGKRRVGLGVDSESLTGATRLYERAGMRVTRQFDRYEKELRPGAG